MVKSSIGAPTFKDLPSPWHSDLTLIRNLHKPFQLLIRMAKNTKPARTVTKSAKAEKKTQKTADLFGDGPPARSGRKAAARQSARGGGGEAGYTAHHIEVLEGLEPVRRRPGMYIGGTDEKALHHLFAEVIDNAMDEALAGHATFIEVEVAADGYLTVTDNGRGIPVDPHPKFPKKSALEIIMCTLHAGGKFDSQVYETSGGLHGVGVSVVNALSEKMEVEVARGQQLYRMTFARGKPKGGLEKLGKVANRRGTKVRFKPDPQIFGDKAKFDPARLFRMARAKAYLFGGVEIRWSCDPSLIKDDTPAEAVLHFPGGLQDYLAASIESATRVHPDIFAGGSEKKAGHGSAEWAVAFVADADPLRLLLLQHHPDPRRRHPRERVAHRPVQGPARPCRAHQSGQARGRDHQRRRDGRRLRDDLGVHPRAGIPGPDQGPPRDRRKPRASSNRRSATRSITGSPAIRCRPTSCSTS